MNTQLVSSIIQVVRSLPRAEQQLLIESLNQLLLQPAPAGAEQLEPEASDRPESTNSEEAIDEEAWAIWQSLGDDAVSGQLENPSIHHDRYLYSQNA